MNPVRKPSIATSCRNFVSEAANIDKLHKKNVFCIRHGTAYHNTMFKTMGPKAYSIIRDTALTDRGIAEAIQLKDNWKEIKNIDLVITSPLLRTLQTTSIIFKDVDVKKIAIDELLEYPQSEQICNMRSDIDYLNKLFPSISFDNIYDNVSKEWEYIDFDEKHEKLKLEKRIENFKKFLSNRDEQNIAVVGHSSYFNYMINNFVDTEITELKHCCPYKITL